MATTRTKLKTVSSDNHPDWVTVRLPKAPKGHANFEEVSVNGKVMNIMRGVDVKIPPEFAEVLRHQAEMHDEADDFIESVSN